MRSSGPGGQHANKVETAIQLRFDIRASSLPEDLKLKLLNLKDQRVTAQGEVLIRSSRYRSRQKNLEDAVSRLNALINKVAQPRKKRIPTKKPRAVEEQRLKEKSRKSELKESRKKPDPPL